MPYCVFNQQNQEYSIIIRCFIGEVSSGLLNLHQLISAPDPCEIRTQDFFVQPLIRRAEKAKAKHP
jgi:hypothetical protein